MTGVQESYLGTLARRAGEEEPEDGLTKAEASKKIEELREKTGMDDAMAKPKRARKASTRKVKP